MNLSPWILLSLSIIGGALGQLFMKVGMKNLNPPDSGLIDSLHNILLFQGDSTQVYSLLWVFLGIGCYLISVVIWIYVLKHFELSMAYPMLSIGYILVYLGAVTWPQIGEEFLWGKTIGITLIMLGVALVASPSQISSGKDND